MKRLVLILFCLSLPLMVWAGGSMVPVGGYLYAVEDKLPDRPGALVLSFTTENIHRMVVAFGRKYRKDRKGREGTTEEDREIFKPRLAKMANQGKFARFDKMIPDYYDIIVIDDTDMTVHEGISLWSSDEEEVKECTPEYLNEIRKSLGDTDDKIKGWEGFFDTKELSRVEVSVDRAGVFMQQLRKGESFAESGDKIQGCIHSLDVVWVTRALDDGQSGWQVINRQQLYRNEIVSRKFFRHFHVKELCGIRVGQREKRVENIELPLEDSAEQNPKNGIDK